MQCNTVILLLCLVSTIQICRAKQWNDARTRDSKRTRRQNDRWSWGYYEYSENVNNPVTDPPTEAPTPTALVRLAESNDTNPCDLPYLEKPDFSAPGRSISDAKCYEYIWEIKYREDRDEKDEACKKYRSQGEPTRGAAFAIGGRPALPGEFPHMGAIGWKAVVGTWIFKCGSTLISNKFVLTAAHCTKGTTRDTSIADVVPKIVRLGDKNIVDVFANGLLPYDVFILRSILHPQYRAPHKYFDIALMELEGEVIFTNNVQPACLWRYFDTSSLGNEATLTGWGVVEADGKDTSPILQAAVVDVIDSQYCDSLLRPLCNRNWCGIQENQICAGKLAGGVDSCQGDSGGPLGMKIPLPPSSQGAMHYVIGVTSFGFGCAEENKPGVYTRVSSFVDWIENIVWS